MCVNYEAWTKNLVPPPAPSLVHPSELAAKRIPRTPFRSAAGQTQVLLANYYVAIL